jgi:hypothetical protein
VDRARRLRAIYRTLALVICAAGVSRCGNSTPSPTGVTTSSITTSAVTTTSVAPSLTSAHYAGTLVQTPPLPPVPLDLSLFFQVPGGSLRPAIRPQAVNFLVTGGYSTGPGGFTGDISGTLDGSPANGIFTGTMTANLATGCIAKRNYSGPLTTAALNWTPGTEIENCGGASPLTFTVTPPAAPTPATTSLPTTTTIAACTYSLSIGSSIDGYPTGGTFTAAVTTQPACAWTATSNAPWIHITAISAASGTGTVTFTADANPTPARVGTLIIAGQTITFNQSSSITTTTSSSSTSTTTSIAGTTSTILPILTTVLTGSTSYSVTSNQLPGFRCSYSVGAPPTTCSTNASGFVQLDTGNAFVNTSNNCTSTGSHGCSLTVTRDVTVTFDGNSGIVVR